MELDLPKFYLSDKVPIITNHKAHQLEEIIPSDTKKHDDINSWPTAQWQNFYVDSLTHIHRTSLQREWHTYWYIIITFTICVMTILAFLCFLICSRLHSLQCYSPNTVSALDTVTQTPDPLAPVPQRETTEQGDTHSKRDVIFTTYAVKPTKWCISERSISTALAEAFWKMLPLQLSHMLQPLKQYTNIRHLHAKYQREQTKAPCSNFHKGNYCDIVALFYRHRFESHIFKFLCFVAIDSFILLVLPTAVIISHWLSSLIALHVSPSTLFITLLIYSVLKFGPKQLYTSPQISS
jgi:hypothetical protein